MADHIDYAANFLADLYEDGESENYWHETAEDLFNHLAARGFRVVREERHD